MEPDCNEQCDDGNSNDNDGCDHLCIIEKLDASLIPCQEAISKGGRKYVAKVFKELQDCRNDINRGKRTIPASKCRDESDIALALDKARAGFKKAVASGCTDAAIQNTNLPVCRERALEPRAIDTVVACIEDDHDDDIEGLLRTEFGK